MADEVPVNAFVPNALPDAPVPKAEPPWVIVAVIG
jgi:hypothetical protein